MIPDRMRAIEITRSGAPDVLRMTEVEMPRPNDNEVLIRVHAAGINRPDVAQRQGSYPPPPGASPLPGLEVSGKIVSVGKNVKRFKVGARVMALIPGGGYAEYAIADERITLPIPEIMDFIPAAAIPETFFTVWSNVFQRAGLKKGETILVHGGSSGIGTTTIQLAKAFGAKVIVTAGNEKKCDACRMLGADLAIDYHKQDFVEVTKTFTDGKGVNVILDMVGGDYVERNYKAAAIEGRIIQIAFLNNHKATINLNDITMKRLVHTGSTLRSREIEFKAEIASALEEHVIPLLATGKIAPLIDMVLPLDEAAKAHRRMEESSHIGKIVLKIAQE